MSDSARDAAPPTGRASTNDAGELPDALGPSETSRPGTDAGGPPSAGERPARTDSGLEPSPDGGEGAPDQAADAGEPLGGGAPSAAPDAGSGDSGVQPGGTGGFGGDASAGRGGVENGGSGGFGGFAGEPSGGSGGAGGPTALLTVSTSGTGRGLVVSDPEGLACDASCEAAFEPGSVVTLTAEALPGSRFIGFSGVCSGLSCTVQLDADAAVMAEFEALPTDPPNVAFVTSTTTTGDMGGLAGADQLCAERALAAGLPGTFIAWLSSSAEDAIDRLAGAGGWLRTDGKPFANDPRGPIYYPLRLDEFGNDLWTGSALTGTNASGTVSPGQTCQDWTAPAGSAATGAFHTTTVSWTTYYGGDTCVYPTHIYCFGTDAYTDVTPSSSSGRLAFLSTGTWSPGGGVATADALCQSEANGAGEAGVFRALLATSTASAMSRFSTSGQTWVRPDGVEIVAMPAALFPPGDGAILDAPINLTLAGEYATAYEFVWTGIGAFYDGRSMQTPGTPETTCDDWQSTSPADEGASGYAADTNLPFGVNGNVTRSCDLALRLYCLEDG